MNRRLEVSTPEDTAAKRDLGKYQLWLAKHNEKTVKKAEIKLAAMYREAYANLDRELAKLYAQMGDPPTIQEARKYNRIASLQKAIAAEYRRTTNQAIQTTQDTAARSFADAALGGRWAYDQATGTEIKWPVLSAEALRESVWSSMTGQDFDDRFRDWDRVDYVKTTQRVQLGIAQGYGYAKTARILREEINRKAYQAMRIVRTESTRAYSQGHLEVYREAEEAGVQARKRWIATLDTRTRDTHGELDGQYADEKTGMFSINGYEVEAPGMFGDPAEDINCRCRVVDEIAGFEPEFRRVRGEGIVPYTTFSDWAGARGWTPEGGWPIEAKAEVSAEQARKY